MSVYVLVLDLKEYSEYRQTNMANDLERKRDNTSPPANPPPRRRKACEIHNTASQGHHKRDDPLELLGDALHADEETTAIDLLGSGRPFDRQVEHVRQQGV